MNTFVAPFEIATVPFHARRIVCLNEGGLVFSGRPALLLPLSKGHGDLRGSRTGRESTGAGGSKLSAGVNIFLQMHSAGDMHTYVSTGNPIVSSKSLHSTRTERNPLTARRSLVLYA